MANTSPAGEGKTRWERRFSVDGALPRKPGPQRDRHCGGIYSSGDIILSKCWYFRTFSSFLLEPPEPTYNQAGCEKCGPGPGSPPPPIPPAVPPGCSVHFPTLEHLLSLIPCFSSTFYPSSFFCHATSDFFSCLLLLRFLGVSLLIFSPLISLSNRVDSLDCRVSGKMVS